MTQGRSWRTARWHRWIGRRREILRIGPSWRLVISRLETWVGCVNREPLGVGLSAAVRFRSELQAVADRRTPCVRVRPMGREERQGEAIHAEGHAASVCRIARGGPEVPGRAKMIAMIIKAHAGGDLILGAHRN